MLFLRMLLKSLQRSFISDVNSIMLILWEGGWGEKKIPIPHKGGTNQFCFSERLKKIFSFLLELLRTGSFRGASPTKKTRMTLTVSNDMSVNTALGRVEEKVEEKKKELQESIEKGQPQIMGVCQIALGLLIISYSTPLLSAENFSKTTLILNFGVPWWSGVMFVISGAVAIAVEKHASVKMLTVCLAVSVLAIIVSIIALVLFYIDIAYNPSTTCKAGQIELCDYHYYATHFSVGVKRAISVIILAQTGLSSAFSAVLYNQRKKFTGYTTVNELHPD